MKRIKMAARFSFPVEVVTQTMGILGRRGSGKTTTASRLAEQLLENNLPVVIIDPTGAWWGLRSSLDGKSEGFPITVLGGDHGDLPLEETAGALIAEMVAESAPPLVLDLSSMSKSGSRRFVQNFCEQLYRKNRTALQVIMDEADEFAPQKLFRDALGVFGAVDTLVRRGRVRGIGVTMVSQRSAAINKDILSQCEVLIAHRASHPTDIEPVMEWMKVHAKDRIQEVHDSIAHLKNGEAWIMSPEWLDFFGRVQILNRTTFNSSATPTPGQRQVEPKRLAAVDLARLQKQMAGTIERARADDPRILRQRIAKLEAELRTVQTKAIPIPAPTEVKIVEKNIIRQADLARIEKLAERSADLITKARAWSEAMLAAVAAQKAPLVPPKEALPKVQGRVIQASTPGQSRAIATPRSSELGLSGAERKILTALAQFPDGRTKPQLAIMAEYAVNGGAFNNALGALRSKGLAEGYGTTKITGAGLEVLGPYNPLPTGRELLSHWLHQLGRPQRLILEYVAGKYPTGASKEEVAAATGYEANGGSFNNALGRLRTLELIHGRGELIASEEFFS